MALRQVLFLATASFLVVQVFGAARRSVDTSTPASNAPQAVKPCQGRTPCGWAVYDKISRYINYFMRNKCECMDQKKCLRDDDDISITAYVYRCKIDDSPSS